MATLKIQSLAFPIRRMLLSAVLASVSMLVSIPMLAQVDSLAVSQVDTVVISKVDSVAAGQDTLSRDSLSYTRESMQVIDAPEYEAASEYNAVQVKDTRLFFTLKTNMLYDVVTALNVEAEIPMLERFSLVLEYVFPWWETGNKYCFQMLEFGPELRFWFNSWDSSSKAKMQGWFTGVYGMSAKYDFQYDTKLNYQGEYWSAGVSVGYVHQMEKLFGKPTNARLEFSLAAGYLSTDFRHYLPTDDYSMLIRDKYNVGRVSYFGPTKAKISLVVPVFVKNDHFRR